MTDIPLLNRRILVIADTPAVIEPYRKVLPHSIDMTTAYTAREALFAERPEMGHQDPYLVDCAEQGSIGCELVDQAVKQQRPYAVAFVDRCMPFGWGGVETIERMWAIDPDIQAVICTAYSDHEWKEVIVRLGHREQLLILRKPFDPIEVQLLANSLIQKWYWGSHVRLCRSTVEKQVDQGMSELRAANTQLEHDVLRRQSVESQLAQTVRDLEQRNQELREARDQALIEVHERERAELALRHKTEELVRSNHELDQFASVAAHDLQEPLHTIEVFSDLLRVKCGEDISDTGIDFLGRIQKASGRMQRLIQDLLVYSRLDTHDRSQESVALREIVDDILSDFAVRIEDGHARVEVGELPVIESDPTRIRQLLQNLIGNALKFHKSGEPPVVRVSACFMKERRHKNGKYAEQLCQISIEDEGIGMDVQYAEQIFGMFKRLHRRDEFEGTGIGLAVCKKIVERCGGHITVQSEIGKGSTFLVTLPLGSSFDDSLKEETASLSALSETTFPLVP